MKLFERLSNGWHIGGKSMLTIKENPSLMLFPVISGVALVLVCISFFGGGYLIFGEEVLSELANEEGTTGNIFPYLVLFLFYLVTYFVIVFFNVGLVFCAKQILSGEDTSVSEGLNFALGRISTILAWAVLSATVGTILRAIQERVGFLGSLITGLAGMAWAIATYFVVPILAFEDVSPWQAVKRSGQIIKDKWGESIGANVSFGLFGIIGLVAIALPIGFIVGYAIHPVAGIVGGIIVFVIIQTLITAAKTVFLAAAYQHTRLEPTGHFDTELLDSTFASKK